MSELDLANYKLSQYKKKVWKDYYNFSNNLKQIKQENRELENKIQSEQAYRKEISNSYEKKIHYLEEKLEMARKMQRQSSNILRDEPPQPNLKSTFKKTELIKTQLEEEGQALDAKTERVLQEIFHPSNPYISSEPPYSTTYNQIPVSTTLNLNPSNSSNSSSNFDKSIHSYHPTTTNYSPISTTPTTITMKPSLNSTNIPLYSNTIPSQTIPISNIKTKVPLPSSSSSSQSIPSLNSLTNPDQFIKKPDVTNPIISNPVVANPVVTNSIVPNPVISNPVISNPVISNPVISNPVISNPVISNPVISNPVISSSTVPKPIVSNPITPNPIASNSITTNPVFSKPIVTNPITQNSIQTSNVVTNSILTQKPEIGNYQSQPFNAHRSPSAPVRFKSFPTESDVTSGVPSIPNTGFNPYSRKNSTPPPSIPKGKSFEPLYGQHFGSSSDDDDLEFETPNPPPNTQTFQFEKNKENESTKPIQSNNQDKPIPKSSENNEKNEKLIKTDKDDKNIQGTEKNQPTFKKNNPDEIKIISVPDETESSSLHFNNKQDKLFKSDHGWGDENMSDFDIESDLDHSKEHQNFQPTESSITQTQMNINNRGNNDENDFEIDDFGNDDFEINQDADKGSKDTNQQVGSSTQTMSPKETPKETKEDKTETNQTGKITNLLQNDSSSNDDSTSNLDFEFGDDAGNFDI